MSEPTPDLCNCCRKRPKDGALLCAECSRSAEREAYERDLAELREEHGIGRDDAEVSGPMAALMDLQGATSPEEAALFALRDILNEWGPYPGWEARWPEVARRAREASSLHKKMNCDVCGAPGEEREDPYAKEVNDEVVMRTLCPTCYQGRAADI